MKKNILWISRFAPIKSAKEAGNKTFRYYFTEFINSNEFNIKLLSCAFYKDKCDILDEFKNEDYDFIFWNNPRETKILKILNLESKFNIFNKHAGIISNVDSLLILKQLKKYKSSGYLPDLIILEWTQIVVLAFEIKKIFPDAKIVASEHDVTYVGYLRKSEYYKGIKKIVWKIKYWYEKKIELKNLKLCDLILPHNPDNKKLLISDGINESKIHPIVPYFNNMKNLKRNSKHKDILFFGAMSRPENYLSAIWFIDNVMPRLIDLDVRFIILGNNPPEELRKRENKRIIITGFVESIEPYFSESMCFVAPLVLGAGIKVKVLEALSSGIPILTNRIGIEGINAKVNYDYFLCEKDVDYEAKIRKLYNNEINEDAMLNFSRKFISENFDLKKSFIDYKDKLLNM